jgi:hypothetical protein
MIRKIIDKKIDQVQVAACNIRSSKTEVNIIPVYHRENNLQVEAGGIRELV